MTLRTTAANGRTTGRALPYAKPVLTKGPRLGDVTAVRRLSNP